MQRYAIEATYDDSILFSRGVASCDPYPVARDHTGDMREYAHALFHGFVTIVVKYSQYICCETYCECECE